MVRTMQSHEVGALARLARLGWQVEDSEEERLAKSIVTLTACLISVLTFVWVGTYLSLGLVGAAAIPFTYQIASLVSLLIFRRTKRLNFFRNSQLVMILFLPFLLQLSLSGFLRSSGVILWALMSPVGALMLLGVKRSLPWFVAYLALLVGAGILEPIVQELDVSIPAPVVIAFFVLNIGGVSTTAYLLLRYFVISRERERAKSERLLLNVLPGPIAARLRETTGSTIADAFDEVSVLFADIVGFTAFSANVGPVEVVQILNAMFSRFDELADRHGLEKIKTIGDAYMVAGGIPAPRPDHAEAVAEMALDMMQEMLVRDPAVSSQLQVRIGIATGPVVAGVIGTRKFIYDLWGDTVNMASRMESHGLPGMIQVTEATYRRLSGKYELRERGKVTVKGKGDMPTWILVGRTVGSASPPAATPR